MAAVAGRRLSEGLGRTRAAPRTSCFLVRQGWTPVSTCDAAQAIWPSILILFLVQRKTRRPLRERKIAFVVADVYGVVETPDPWFDC